MQVKDSIFKNTAYKPFNMATYNYKKIYKIAMFAYKYKKKRY
jgi:hypothetical protein